MSAWSMGRLAWRNLWRNPRRTAITLSSIALASILAAMFNGLQDASWKDVINLAARLGGGHLTVQHPDYREKPVLSRTVKDTRGKAERILATGRALRVVPRVVGQVMVATAAESSGAAFMAIDPRVEDTRTLSLLEAITEGKLFATARERSVVLGSRLARNLGARLGEKIVYTLTDKHGEIVSGMARVSGLMTTGSPGIDLGLCLFPLDSVRDTLGYADDEATQLAVFLSDHRDAPAMTALLSSAFTDGAVALTWDQNQPDLASFIAMKRGGMVFFEILILVLAAAGIFNTMLVSVMERLREFGILLAVGLSPPRLFGLVMWESMWLALCGIASGVIIGAWPYTYLNRTGIDLAGLVQGGSRDVAGITVASVLRVELYPESALMIAVAVIVATLASGLYPAWRAGSVEPMETIRLV